MADDAADQTELRSPLRRATWFPTTGSWRSWDAEEWRRSSARPTSASAALSPSRSRFPKADSGPDTIRRFLREVRLVARLVHPNIVALLGAFDHGGLPWLVMELVEGPSLGALIDRDGPFEPAEVVRHGVGLASALGLAHGRGILHGDVSPGNILMAADGRAKLTDFGLASFLAAPRRGDMGSGGALPEPGRGAITGTPGYMAPEKARGEQSDPRSDLFSLGAVLYELCAGGPAFPGSTKEELLDATLVLEPAELAARNPRVPRALEAIILKALAKSPDGRHQSAAALEGELRTLL